ncbi:MAG: SUMF1/EgtB/PvdO family nonheme iron enzyme [Candidatus Cloacimonetes bacterium]|nr:SUMF1/EgtB/PvdO family nonheme iron enzyme [Candidatus Cloacimonadota bacterium]
MKGVEQKQSQILRGGSWNNNDNNCRVANRNNNNPDNSNNNNGFRFSNTFYSQNLHFRTNCRESNNGSPV